MFMVYIELQLDHEQVSLVLQFRVPLFDKTNPFVHGKVI